MRAYVAGHRGMVGSAIARGLEADGAEILTATRSELDLADQSAVRSFLARERPDTVIVAAANVGGIHANNTMPAEFIYENLMIECNFIDSALRAGVERLLFLGSSCIYPRNAGLYEKHPSAVEVLFVLERGGFQIFALGTNALVGSRIYEFDSFLKNASLQ